MHRLAYAPLVQHSVFSRSGGFAITQVPGLCAVKQCTRGTGELTLLNLFSNCEGARLGCPHCFVISLLAFCRYPSECGYLYGVAYVHHGSLVELC